MAVRKIVSIRTRFAVAAIALAAIAAGCGVLSVDEPGDNARIRISGTAPGTLRLVLSNNFIQVFDTQQQEVTVSLLGSDTIEISSLPYDSDYSLDGNLRFFLRLINPDSAKADLRIQVNIDNVDPYDVTTSLTASQHEYTYTAF